MKKADIIERLKAGEELVYASLEGRVRIGRDTIRWPQYIKLLSEGKIREREYRDYQHFYRWVADVPATP